MQELNELEQQLLENLVLKYPSLEPHLPHLAVRKRNPVSTGIVTELAYVDFAGERKDINALFSNGEIIAIPQLKKGLAYVIDVTEGCITSIEFVTYGEKWDGKVSQFSLVQHSPGE